MLVPAQRQGLKTLAVGGSARIFDQLIRTNRPGNDTLRLLDFGCGSGGLVRDLTALGYDAYGTDLGSDWQSHGDAWKRSKPGEHWEEQQRLRPLVASPYRIPFDTGTFDVVVSNQVFEHAANKKEAMLEIARVLKPGGLVIHSLPSKWRIIEPHIFVPFASWMWPNVPDWWLALWAILGIRSESQRGKSWRAAMAHNRDYCRHGLHYWSGRRLRALLEEVHGSAFDFSPTREIESRKLMALVRALPFARWPIMKAFGSVHSHWIGTRSG